MPKLYTKQGDNGHTSLYDGSKRKKSNYIFDVLGDLDELSSNIGKLISFIKNKIEYHEYNEYFLRYIQVILLDIGSNIAVIDENQKKNVPEFKKQYVTDIENMIDKCDIKNSKLTEFILSGVYLEDSQCHICRSVCRRLERNMWKLVFEEQINIEQNILKYINRLSDFFFSFSRNLSKGQEIKLGDIKKQFSMI